MEYKFRAECYQDAANALSELQEKLWFWSITPRTWDDGDLKRPMPDVEVEISTDYTLEQIIKIMKTVVDGHVMYQTLRPVESYTGERNYDIKGD